MQRHDLISKPWNDYELVDSGNNRKLERFGSYLLIRPETQALWMPQNPDAWKRAHAEFRWAGQKGTWQTQKNMRDHWELSWSHRDRAVRFTARFTNFKHIGVFPEQAANWEWINGCVKALTEKKAGAAPHVLNLFGYTGIASIVAAQAGAQVTHVDASKQSNMWAKENATLSKTPEGSIRFLLDDALGFVMREGRRGARYEGIILDPPAFGRGAKGEVWRIEEHLGKLLAALKTIFAQTPGSFFLLNGYAAGYSPSSFLQAAQSAFTGSDAPHEMEFGELAIEESGSRRIVPSGIYLRFIR